MSDLQEDLRRSQAQAERLRAELKVVKEQNSMILAIIKILDEQMTATGNFHKQFPISLLKQRLVKAGIIEPKRNTGKLEMIA